MYVSSSFHDITSSRAWPAVLPPSTLVAARAYWREMSVPVPSQ